MQLALKGELEKIDRRPAGVALPTYLPPEKGYQLSIYL